MRLVDVYSNVPRACNVLYLLLAERMPNESISHKSMPSVLDHVRFVESRPYADWFLIESRSGDPVGAVYLTRQREIGVGIFKAFRGRSYATRAVQHLMRLHPGRFLANINPANEASIALFRKLGFGGPIQITLAKEPE